MHKLAAWAIFAATLGFIGFAQRAYAQTTEFAFQGSLKDSGSPANANYDFEFALFDALAGGSQIGSTIPKNTVLVTNGVFAVKLDFGSVFPGASRYLEIRVKLSGQPTLTPLTPRQLVNSAPYSIKTLNADNATNAANATTATNATQLGGVAASQYVLTGDSRMSDTRVPSAGSSSYIQNQNAAPQATSSFNVSGTGTANMFNAATQFNLGGTRFLSVGGTENLFAGINAGTANTTGQFNSFVGIGAGTVNTTGNNNTFIGRGTGASNTTAANNTFVGASAGNFNTLGFSNSFFGRVAGLQNTTGDSNSFSGFSAGLSNTIGSRNSFFGLMAGASNTEGSNNSFFGDRAGETNVTGGNNTLIGFFANVASDNLTFATAIGSNAVVSTSNTLVLGRGADTVQIPGNLNVMGNVAGNFSVPASNIAGVLGPLSGGTGIGGAFPVAGTFLRSNGAGWSASGIFAMDVPGGSTSYVQNGTSQQATSNFNVSGTGTANIFNAATQFNIGGSRVFSVGGINSTFAGVFAGPSTTGGDNSFFGRAAGFNNTTGSGNSFFGLSAGTGNTLGVSNSFFGVGAGRANATGSNNTIIGWGANVGSDNLSNASAIGFDSLVSQSNSLVLGSINGLNGATADTNVGIGTTAPISRLHINGNTVMTFTNSANTVGRRGYRLAFDNDRFTFQSADDAGNFSANQIAIDQATGNFGVGITTPTSKLHVVGDGLFTGNLTVNGTINATLPTGSASYIQNQNASPQTTSNFNVSGTGTANIFNAATQYNINGTRAFSVAGSGNLFVGPGAGSTGSFNTFVGAGAGQFNTASSSNSFFGFEAGQANTFGNANSFFGYSAGLSNTTATFNSYFGVNAGRSTTGEANSFFGYAAGDSTTTGGSNTFFGFKAGLSNSAGSNNMAVGYLADLGQENLTNATAIGANAVVSQSNSLVLGNNANVGIGTETPLFKFHVRTGADQNLVVRQGSDFFNALTGIGLQSINDANSQYKPLDLEGSQVTLNVGSNGNVGIGTPSPTAKLHVTGGNVYIAQPNSLIITSPNGACWFITVGNTGTLSTISVTCP